MCVWRGGSRILVRGAQRSFDPRGWALTPKFAHNRGFPLKISWKLHDFEINLGGRGPRIRLWYGFVITDINWWRGRGSCRLPHLMQHHAIYRFPLLNANMLPGGMPHVFSGNLLWLGIQKEKLFKSFGSWCCWAFSYSSVKHTFQGKWTCF